EGTAGVRTARFGRRDRAAADDRRRAGREGARRDVLEQPDLARRNPGQLLPGLQHPAELRQSERGENARREVNSPFAVSKRLTFVASQLEVPRAFVAGCNVRVVYRRGGAGAGGAASAAASAVAGTGS